MQGWHSQEVFNVGLNLDGHAWAAGQVNWILFPYLLSSCAVPKVAEKWAMWDQVWRHCRTSYNK